MRRTQDQAGLIIPAVITAYADRTFTFELKSPPAAVLLKKAAKVKKGSGEPNREKVGRVSQKDLEEIAEIKKADLNAWDVEAAKKIIAGTARIDGSRSGGRVEMSGRSKRYRQARDGVEVDKLYSLEEAMGLIKDFPTGKFDESVDVAVNLGVDPKHADQMVRGAIVLPTVRARISACSGFRQGR